MSLSTDVVVVRRLISANKAIAAGLSHVATVAAADAAIWIASGNFDATELRVAAGGLASAIITTVVTYFVSAGDAEVEVTPAITGGRLNTDC